MDNSRKFKIPYLDLNQIRESADNFRTNSGVAGIPVDVELIAEKEGIDLIPIPSLRFLSDMEACIVNSMKEIQYEPRSVEIRLRFSIAHELGHFKMHSTQLLEMNPRSYEDWHDLIEYIPNNIYQRMEFQANEFAGRLLVPVEYLKESFQVVKSDLLIMREFINDNFYLSYPYIAKDLAKKFNVSEDVMKKRLIKEELNPYEFI